MAIVAMARNLGLQVVAEGEETLDQLRALGSLEGQTFAAFGAYFKKPPPDSPRTVAVISQADDSHWDKFRLAAREGAQRAGLVRPSQPFAGALCRLRGGELLER